MPQLVVIHAAAVYAVPAAIPTVWSTGASTKLIFDAPAAGTLNIQKVGSDPIAITKRSFEAGSNAINVAVSSTPRIIRCSVAEINIMEAVNETGFVKRNERTTRELFRRYTPDA